MNLSAAPEGAIEACHRFRVRVFTESQLKALEKSNEEKIACGAGSIRFDRKKGVLKIISYSDKEVVRCVFRVCAAVCWI